VGRTFRFHQLDVFTDKPLLGNALAVVHQADGLSDADMAALARWTNLSETTFLLKPTHPEADYRVRIFTPGDELPFAGHPTLGSCHAWLAAGGKPKSPDLVKQECAVGIVPLRRDGKRLAFAAPPLHRTGEVDEPTLVRLSKGLGIPRSEIKNHQWVDNGPGWCALILDSAKKVLDLNPEFSTLRGLAVGVLAMQPPGQDSDIEVRAFVPSLGVPEDPVTGSLNAGIAQWMMGAGLIGEHYVAAQGTVLQRKGRVYLDKVGKDIWVGGQVVVCVDGSVTF
jgi:PhzF family phenazine biosynthesis protein